MTPHTDLCECGNPKRGYAARCITCSRARLASKPCSIEGCDSPVKARGWCKVHYGHWQRHGHPLALSAIGRRRLETESRGNPPVARRNDPKHSIKNRVAYITGGQWVPPAILQQDMDLAHSLDALTPANGADGLSREEVLLVRCPKCSSDTTWPCYVPPTYDPSKWDVQNRAGIIHEERIQAAVQARAEHRI